MGASLAVVDLGSERTAVSVSAGSYFTCALLVSRCRARREQFENANAFALIVAQTKGRVRPRLSYLAHLFSTVDASGRTQELGHGWFERHFALESGQ